MEFIPHADILTSPLAEAVLTQKINTEDYSTVFILCDDNTHTHCLPVLNDLIPETVKANILLMREGELNKNISTCTDLWKELSAKGADRNSLLINLGGGVVTDLGGFVACTYKRGIPFLNIPTSLLSMVDASVGGKTGIDLGVLKNQIGIIREPEAVLILPQFLQTLPTRHLKNGFVEMLKHGLIADKAHWDEITPENCHEIDSILHSIEIKSQVVQKDPNEKGLRKILNFGHTLGHAIESFLLNHPDRSPLLHGEAIAIGLVLEAYLSHRASGLSILEANQVKHRIASVFPKQKFSAEEIEVINSLMLHDKKNLKGQVRFALLRELGAAVFDQFVDHQDILDAFDYYASA